MPGSNLRNFETILGLFFPATIPLAQTFYAFATLGAVVPLYRLHRNQRREARQPQRTAWTSSITSLIFNALDDPVANLLNENQAEQQAEIARDLTNDLEGIYDLLGVDIDQDETLFPESPVLLVTKHHTCKICPADELRTLRRRVDAQAIRILGPDFQWKKGFIFIAHCPTCRSDYYPDKYTYNHNRTRYQKLDYDCQYFRISKSGIWAHKNVALAQEKGIYYFHAGWSNFAGWLNGVLASKPEITNRQSQRLFLEHFSRRLLTAYGKAADFCCPAHPSTSDFARYLRDFVGIDGGRIPASLTHGCIECTHKKRYRRDLIEEGATLNAADDGVAELEGANLEQLPGQIPPLQGHIPNGLADRPRQEAEPPEGEPRGYVRLAVMDGKTVGHRICAVTTCKKALINYKNGRFCEDHLNMRNICGIIPCGRRVSPPGALTCDDPAHQDWHRRYLDRFSRLSFPGVRRVMRRQQEAREASTHGTLTGPVLQVEQRLPSLGQTEGNQVVHTFRARSVYCLQTVQWACGVPIGWGKCYNSESSPQVLGILKRIWHGQEDLRPSFIAYDDACDLLRHIVTQDPQDPWLHTTKFIVDAWHYIGHKATDILCRNWCNPAPKNGSQPDLILIQTDDNGQKHTTRAFNTEAAEQLNSWLDGFEAQLRQMSDVNYDIFVHAIMLIYKEHVENKIRKREMELPDSFWDD